MRKITLSCGVAIAISALIMTHFLRDKSELDKTFPALSCKGEVHFGLQKPDSTVVMNGNMSIITLGAQRLALHYSGQLKAPEGKFYVNRTLFMDYLYHPENQVMELKYVSSSISTLDTVPNDLFYRTLIRSDTLLMKLSAIGNNVLLLSSPDSPKFMCISR